MDKKERVKYLVDILNKAGKSYYQDAIEIMPNIEYDKLYDELLALEKETGFILSASPTRNVGYEILSELPKKEHESPMLSLNKTKEVADLINFVGNKEALLSWKMDGLTIVLQYENGGLISAVTRGNGIIGEVITNNAKCFVNIPLNIDYKGSLTLRGEAIIKYSDFEKINDKIEGIENKYKNPRNLCSGSVRQLNPSITKERNVYFYAFALVSATDFNNENSREKELLFLKENGFDIVEYKKVDKNNISEAVEYFRTKIEDFDIPSDGLVLLLDDIAYGESLGTTAKFPRNAIAFKWTDELKETKLLEIEWSPSRTGLINPVAIFEPVELEGTTVSRASVHNLSILESLELGVGDIIKVYKANMIIPQIEDNLTRSSNLEIPRVCPACNSETSIKNENGIKTLYCTNQDCPAKHIKLFSLASSRDMLNIDGLSEATLEKFLAHGFIKELADLFRLKEHRAEIISMDGFGDKSYENLDLAIEKARHTSLARVLASLGINGIGSANAKLIAKYFDENIDLIRNADIEDFTNVDGIGEILANTMYAYFHNEKNKESLDRLLAELIIEKSADNIDSALENQIFVITGSLEKFKNRKELQALIESRGGKVVSSVSAKTTYLINNDTLSNSSKNKKAKELGVKIISEEDFLNLN